MTHTDGKTAASYPPKDAFLAAQKAAAPPTPAQQWTLCEEGNSLRMNIRGLITVLSKLNDDIERGLLEAQARLAFQNLKAVLEKAGAKPQHITHLQLFFVDTGQGTTMMEKVEVVFRVKNEVMPECKAAGTGVRVIELVLPELLLEVQAIAVVS